MNSNSSVCLPCGSFLSDPRTVSSPRLLVHILPTITIPLSLNQCWFAWKGPRYLRSCRVWRVETCSRTWALSGYLSVTTNGSFLISLASRRSDNEVFCQIIARVSQKASWGRGDQGRGCLFWSLWWTEEWVMEALFAVGCAWDRSFGPWFLHRSREGDCWGAKPTAETFSTGFWKTQFWIWADKRIGKNCSVRRCGTNSAVAGSRRCWPAESWWKNWLGVGFARPDKRWSSV